MNITYRPMLAVLATAVFAVPVIAQPNTTREKVAEALKPLADANVKAAAEYTCNISLINLERENALDMMNGRKPPMSRYDTMIAKATECMAGPGSSSLVYDYRAKAYAAKGNTKLAIADLDKAIATNKTENSPVAKQHELYESRADVYIQIGDRAKAEADLREAVRLNPSGYSAKDKLDNLDAKIAEARKKAAIDNPQTAADFIIVGTDHYNLGRYDQAVAAFDRSNALTLSAAAYIGKGKALWAQKRFEAALAEMNKAVALSPKDSEALSWRGNIHHELKNWDEAIADYTAALAVAPVKEKPGVLNARGSANTNKGLYAAAMKDHTAALAAGGDDVHVKIAAETGKGDAFRAQGMTAEALAAYTTAINAAGTDFFMKYSLVDAWLGRGRLYASQGKTDLAKADFGEVLKLLPDSKEAKEELAKLNGTAAGSQPMTAEYWAAEGRRQGSVKDYAGAIKSFSECLRLKPDAFACYALRGGVYGLSGDINAARADFDKALELGKSMQAPIYFIRGMMYAELGSRDEAVADFRSTLKIDPNNAQAKMALQRLGVQP